MTSRLRDIPGARDSLADVGGRSLRRYLERQGWHELARSEDGALVVLEDPHDPLHQVRVPLNEMYSDYVDALETAVERTGEALQIPASDLLFRLRVEQNDVLVVSALTGAEDTLPVGIGIDLLNATWKTITASAWAEHVPRPGRSAYFGPRPARVSEFLGGLRMAHTRPGSFSFPFLSPLPEPDEGQEDDVLGFVLESFERRALRKAVTAVEAAVESAVVFRDTREFRFNQRIPDGVSANLCRALADLPHEVGVRFEASWSPIVPEPSKASEVPPGLGEIFEEAAEKLGPEAAEGRVTVVGHVRLLQREHDEETGEVGVRSLLRDLPGVFRIALDPAQYAAAVEAHADDRPVFIEGELERLGGGPRRIVDAQLKVLGFEMADLVDDGIEELPEL